jgi:hypothetical protein
LLGRLRPPYHRLVGIGRHRHYPKLGKVVTLYVRVPPQAGVAGEKPSILALPATAVAPPQVAAPVRKKIIGILARKVGAPHDKAASWSYFGTNKDFLRYVGQGWAKVPQRGESCLNNFGGYFVRRANELQEGFVQEILAARGSGATPVKGVVQLKAMAEVSNAHALAELAAAAATSAAKVACSIAAAATTAATLASAPVDVEVHATAAAADDNADDAGAAAAAAAATAANATRATSAATAVEAAAVATAHVATAANAAIIQAAGLPERAAGRVKGSADSRARWTAAEDAKLAALIKEHKLVFDTCGRGGSNYDFLSMMLGRTAIAIQSRLFLRRMQFRGDTK